MKPFEYISAVSLNEAAQALAENGPSAKVLAGGTDLLLELRRPGTPAPKAVVDISRLEELNGIETRNESIVVRPLVTHAQLQASELIRRHASLLGAAASTIGSPQIRNRGTVGGNIMNAAACADTVPPLLALGAQAKFFSVAGERQCSLADLFVKPYVTVARSNEILTEITFSKLPSNARCAFVKLGRRGGVSISRLSVAAIIFLNPDGVISDARIVPGAAFPTWRRIKEAEDLLIGRKPSVDLYSAAGRKVSDVMVSVTGRRWSTEYKEPVIGVLVRRALEACAS